MNPAYDAIARYSEITPRYREPLDFLRKILEFQSSLKDEIRVYADKSITERQVNTLEILDKLQSGRPLLEKESVPVSPYLFREGMERLRALLPEESTGKILDRLLASKSMAPGNVETVLEEMKTDIDTCVRELAKVTDTKADILFYLLQIVLAPFFENQAGFYRSLIDSGSWRHGKCPMCGSEPAIARLAEQDGRRFLACSLCNTEWIFDRLRCPFCEHEEMPQIRHFIVDDDEAHRVECCDICRRYLKVVDERVVGHPVIPRVEDVITAHLDVLAAEQGYR